MSDAAPGRLEPPVHDRDHALGDPAAPITLVEYAALTTDRFWEVHDALMKRGATLGGADCDALTASLPPREDHEQAWALAAERVGSGVLRHGPPEPVLRAMDAIHDRIESPAAKLLRSAEPWSSYLVLPLFALANAGLAIAAGDLVAHATLMAAIVAGLVAGKPLGMLGGAWLAVRLGVAAKPDAYTWRQLLGAGALAGIGFTMSLYIAGKALPADGAFQAAKLAIFAASLLACAAGTALLWPAPRRRPQA